MNIFITYKLREGVSHDEYRRWSREFDQPTVLRQPGILSYSIYQSHGPEGPDSPWDILEHIEAESLEAWSVVRGQEEMGEVLKVFERLCDRTTLQIAYGTSITAEPELHDGSS